MPLSGPTERQQQSLSASKNSPDCITQAISAWYCFCMGAYDSQLSGLIVAETQIIEAMASGASATSEWEIRGRRVRFVNLADELLKIRKLIAIYTNLNSGRSNGPAKSRARLRYD